MFYNNRYLDYYNAIIEKRKHIVLTENYETHHIIPRCLGGSNETFNLVRLTFREHFVCHRLLTKCMKDVNKAKRMFSAMCMTRSKTTNRINHSRTYDFYREQGIRAKLGSKLSEQTKHKIKVSLTGKPHTTERKAKISNTLKGRFPGSKNANAKTWVLENVLTGETFTCTGNIHEECKNRNLSSYLLMEYYRKKRPPASKGKTAGWRIKLLL